MATINDAILALNASAIFQVGAGGTYEEIDWMDTTPIAKETVTTKWNELNTATAHISTRAEAYPQIVEQLDLLYHDMAADKGDKTGEWFKAVKAVKDATPKG